MNALVRVSSFAAFFALAVAGYAQQGIITTYAGPQLPVNGALATTQSLDWIGDIVSDQSSGFYVSSSKQNRVYRVTAGGTISLVAGTGLVGFSGDGGPATAARLSSPDGLAVDSAGNLFISDHGNYRIRKVTPSGTISTVAGNGSGGFSGDGGPATAARLSSPHGLAVDSADNLFIADVENNRIRKVTQTGIISTVAGNGTRGFSGDGGPATAAQLSSPYGVAVDDAGNLFIADMGNNRVRKVTAAGIINTVAGTGDYAFNGDGIQATEANLNFPVDLAVDGAGNLFIADLWNYRIRMVAASGIISTVAGNGESGFSGDSGPATAATLDGPTDVAVDAAGNLFIVDSQNERVRKVTSGGTISTVAGDGTYGFSGDGGPAVAAKLGYPLAVTLDTAGNLFFSDEGRVRKVTPEGVISTVAGGGNNHQDDGIPAIEAAICARGIAVNAGGDLFIADDCYDRVRKVTPGGIISTMAGNGTEGFGGDGGPAAAAQLNRPFSVTVDAEGNLFIGDDGNNRIRKVTPEGIISTVAGNGTRGFSGDGGQATAAQLRNTYGLAVDNSGNLFIADYGNNRIRKVTPEGIISTVAGNGASGFAGDGGPAAAAKLKNPMDVAVDAAGNLFIADCDNYRIRQVTPEGIISTVAGNGILGFSVDGGPATIAQISTPWGVALDTTDNLFIADANNHRIRRVAGRRCSSLMNVSGGGAAACETAGGGWTTRVGYAKLAVNSGPAPYGTAVFSFRQNGVTVTEAGVPASPPTTRARIFIDYRSNALAMPGRSDAGTIDVNTGIAVVNYASEEAQITYTLRNLSGSTLTTGSGKLAAGNHFAKFIDQFGEVASGFSVPADFQFGSLEISSDQPLSILALRMTANQADEILYTTTPVADLTKSIGYVPVYFPQFADGDGYTTSLLLLNTSSSSLRGTLQIFDNHGQPMTVTQAGGISNSSFRYYIPYGGSFRFQTDGSPVVAKVGWVLLTPDPSYATPVASGVFGYNPGTLLLSESGISATSSTTHARVYVDLSGRHNTGVAIANVGTNSSLVTINAFEADGVTPAGTSLEPLQLDGRGHDSRFADQLVDDLPAGFTGVLDISSENPFAALTLRSLYNELDHFLMTTFPVADANQAAPSPIVFPQVADGGGYITKFILISAGEATSTQLNLYDQGGTPSNFTE